MSCGSTAWRTRARSAPNSSSSRPRGSPTYARIRHIATSPRSLAGGVGIVPPRAGPPYRHAVHDFADVDRPAVLASAPGPSNASAPRSARVRCDGRVSPARATAPVAHRATRASATPPTLATKRSPLGESDLDARRGSVLVRRGKGGRRREVGIDDWAWDQLQPWLTARVELPIGPLLGVATGPTCGRAWSPGSATTAASRPTATSASMRSQAPRAGARAAVCRLRLGERLVGEVRKRRPPPHRQAVAQHFGRTARLARRQQPPPLCRGRPVASTVSRPAHGGAHRSHILLCRQRYRPTSTRDPRRTRRRGESIGAERRAPPKTIARGPSARGRPELPVQGWSPSREAIAR